MFYYLVFGAMSVVVAVLEFSKNNKDRINTSTAFNAFKNNYLVVYSLMMGKLRSDMFLYFYINLKFPFRLLVLMIRLAVAWI